MLMPRLVVGLPFLNDESQRGENLMIMHNLLEMDVYGEFMNDAFDVKVYASQLIQTGLPGGIPDHLVKLSDGIRAMDKELKHQVSLHHEDLLSQVASVETLEHVLGTMHLRMQSLLSGVERLRVRVVDPYARIVILKSTLFRLQSACDLLRYVAHVSHLASRLKGQLQGGTKEITRCAETLSELDHVGKSLNTSSLNVLNNDQVLIHEARESVEKQADDMLHDGINKQDKSKVAIALQVFQNLGILKERVSAVVDKERHQLECNVKDALDLRQLSYSGMPESRGVGPGRASLPSMGNAALFRSNLWTNVEKLINQIYESCFRVQHLQRVICLKRDSITHISFISILMLKDEDSVGGNALSQWDVTSVFWSEVTSVLTKEFVRAANESMFIKQAFEGEFPKLLRLCSDLWRRLQLFSFNFNDAVNASNVQPMPDVEANVALFDPEAALRATLEPFQNAYLSRSLSRLFDPINVMFSPGCELPTTDEVASVLRTVFAELNVASVDRILAMAVAKNVANTVQLFVVKCEELLSNEGETSQDIRPLTIVHDRNAAVVNLLHSFEVQLKKVIQQVNLNVPEEAMQIVSCSLAVIRIQMLNVIKPLLSSVEEAIESILLTMHDEDFSISMPSDGHTIEVQASPCSMYMKELQDFVARVATDYLSHYKCSDFIADNIRPVACHTIELFIRHISLVRPLSEGGKRRVAADFAQMELCLRPICSQLNDLGNYYRMLRAFRPLLFQTPEHVIKSPALGSLLPYSTVLNFLFSKAPPEFRSPHQTAGWSPATYSSWLSNHQAELDRLEFINGALESYVSYVRQKQSKEFSPIYPIMVELLQSAMQHHQQQQ